MIDIKRKNERRLSAEALAKAGPGELVVSDFITLKELQLASHFFNEFKEILIEHGGESCPP
jgi:hypothetical protein